MAAADANLRQGRAAWVNLAREGPERPHRRWNIEASTTIVEKKTQLTLLLTRPPLCSTIFHAIHHVFVPSIYTTWLACTMFLALLRFCCLSSTQLWPKQVSSQPLDLLHSPHPARQHHGCYSPRSARPTLIWCLQCIATRYCIKIELRFTLFRALRPAPFATAYLTCASTRIPPAPTCAALRLDHSELHTVHAQCHAALLSSAVLRGRRLRQGTRSPAA